MNFPDLLRARGIDFKPGGRNGEVNLCCPFCIDDGHSPDERFRLGVNWVAGFGHCFNCDWSSRNDTLLKIMRRLDLQEEELTTGEVTKLEPKKIEDIDIPEEFERFCGRPRDKTLRRAYDYLRNRNVTEDQIDRHRVGICLSGEYAYRVVFPVRYGKRVVGLVARDFTGKQDLKYKNSPGMKGLFNCHVKKKNKIAILAEGIMDALAIERAFKKKDAIAVLGRAITDEQQEMLKGYQRLVLWPDLDRDGLKGVLRIGEKLASEFQVEVVILPDDVEKDPGAMSTEEIRELYRNRAPFDEAILKIRSKIAFLNDVAVVRKKRGENIWDGR